MLVEQHTHHIGRVLEEELVDPDEVDIGIISSRRRRVGGDEESDRDDHIRITRQRSGDVGFVVGFGYGLDEARVVDAEAFHRTHQALKRELVERAVIDLADVGDQVRGEPGGCL